jgi:nicotinamide mononucleotide (NMN) deamidase PncC
MAETIYTSDDLRRIEAIIEQLTESPFQIALALTGAGFSIPWLLWEYPGCSKNLIAADLVYSEQELENYCGQEAILDGAVSLSMAQKMAEVAMQRHPEAAFALSLTAAVTSNTRHRRGENKGHLALRWNQEVANEVTGGSQKPTVQYVSQQQSLQQELFPRSLLRQECERVLGIEAFTIIETALNSAGY